VWTIGSWAANVLDAAGVQWVVSATQGWYEGPGVRLNQSPIARYDGGYRTPSYRAVRVVTLTGWAEAPSKAVAEQARIAFLGMFSGGGQATLTCIDDYTVRTAAVELGDAPKASPVSQASSFDWQLVLSAVDPRMYDPNALTAFSVAPLTTGGLDWSTGGGLDWSTGGGLNWGTVVSNGTITLTNPGTAEAWPAFTLTGPLSFPVLAASNGSILAYTGSIIAAGDTVVIDTSPYHRTVLLNGTTDRRPHLETAEWFAIVPQQPVTVSLSTSNSADTGSVSSVLNPAYW
jgi:hypothetical protein